MKRTVVHIAALALAALALGGCNKKTALPMVPNEPPTVRLTAAPVDTITSDGQRLKYFYAYKLNWVGYDPDGRVDHFLYTIDRQKTPPGQPIRWTTTQKYEQTFFFNSGVPEIDTTTGRPSVTNPLADDFHIFSIKAVDNLGAESEVAERAFFSFTQAPSVDIDEPHPSHLAAALVTPFVRVSWHGQDPDGQFTQKPVKYKFKLFKAGNNEFDFETIKTNPDSLRRFYAPTFAGWDSTGPESTFVTYSNLVPNSFYIFVVVAFDEAGAYSPIFSLDHNIVWMQVSFAGQSGPAINIYNEFFNYQYGGGGFPSTQQEKIQRTIFLEVPAGIPIHFNWGANASAGALVKQYRWMMDNQNLDDETPRSNELTDTFHWSQWSLSNVSCTVGPFPNDTTHYFFVEAEDVNGLISLGIVQFHVIAVPPENQRKDLVVINDTRLLADQKLFFPQPSNPDSLQNPPGEWPSRAELDTFLFANGGRDPATNAYVPVRWRYTPSSPAPTMSYPGIFCGYDYDTIYTKVGKFNNAVPLSELVKYRHVVWISDYSGWNVANAQTTGVNAMYVMSGAGSANTLAAYVTLGGAVWACGGGFAGSTMMNGWDKRPNNLLSPALPRYANTPFGGAAAELVPGRFLYDIIKWQSEVWLANSLGPIFRSARLPADGSWTNSRYGISCPPYSTLPQYLRPKDFDEPDIFNPDGTSRYPYRDYDIYTATRAWAVEVLPGNNNTTDGRTWGMGLGANVIVENVSTNPDSQDIVSTLDTLMIVRGAGTLPPTNQTLDDPQHYNENVVMTYYHGYSSPPFLFSGFDLWSPARSEIIQMVDFVLQHVWNLQRQPIDRAGTNALRAAHVRRR